jgi:hypothetical protein
MSAYPKGHEPVCPFRLPGCAGKIVSRAARGCSSCQLHRKRAGDVNAGGPPSTKAVAAPAGDRTIETDDRLELERTSKKRIKTLAELVRFCDVDTAVWRVKSFECTKWDMGSVPRATGSKATGWRRPSTKPVVTELYRVRAIFERISPREQAMKVLAGKLLADIRADVKAAPRLATRRPSRAFVDSGYLFEFSPFDLHMGKLAWDEETVTNYDSNIAEDLFNASLDFLLERALRVTGGRIERVLCVFGNDVAHIDSKKVQTTAGTPMDADTRYIKIFRRIVAIHLRALNILRGVAPVDVKIVSGNHDEQTAFFLGEVLTARYHGDTRVTIDNGARQRKYYEYGVNLFGFTHGDSEKIDELPLTMAREQPALWARCPSREWHIGHKHISEKMELRHPARLEQDFFSDKGVRIRRLTSLSGHDAWHTKHAYMDRRACEAFVFHKRAGFTDHLSFNVDHFTGKALSL